MLAGHLKSVGENVFQAVLLASGVAAVRGLPWLAWRHHSAPALPSCGLPVSLCLFSGKDSILLDWDPP